MSEHILADAPAGCDLSDLRTERMAKSLYGLYQQWVADGRPRRKSKTVKSHESTPS